MFWKVLGSLLLIKYGITLSQFLWMMMRLYFLPRFGMKKDLKKYGKWAVITGATDGIGKAIAKQLAKRGINIVLISRSEEKLKSVADEFGSLGVDIKTITYDFNNVDDYENIEKQLQDLEIGILVNNVGVSYGHPDYFMEYSNDVSDRMININITSLLKMTRMVMDGMFKRKTGLVVNVSSASGLMPVPLLSVYSASKAFVCFFSKALQSEYPGIYTQVLCPFFVATNLSQMRPRGVMVPSADRYAASAVDAFGLNSSICGWWSHEIQRFIQSILPEWFIEKKTMELMMGGRKKWLRKQQQKSD